MVDALKAGKFGFYKDSELREPLSDGNLYDQMTADGEIEFWFGGKTLWIPDLGEFEIMAYCKQTFFWDILDSTGSRNINGFDEIQITRNEMIEPFYGDLVPLNPEEVFDIYDSATRSSVPTELNMARIWWFNHMFKDQYYRHSAIALPYTAQTMNEIDAQILPINHNVILPSNHYVYGFRPKFEYYSKLSVMRKLVTGDKGKIHFKLKVDMSYLAENPDTSRTVRLFSQTDDLVSYLPYQKDPTKILWEHQRNEYKRLFLNYLLEHALSIYMPDDGAFEGIEQQYNDMMWHSNLILQADSATYELIKKDILSIYGGYDRIYVGHTVLMLDYFVEWYNYNSADEEYEDPDKILKHTMLTKKYFKGFSLLADAVGLITIESPYVGPVIPFQYPEQSHTIVESLEGAREYSNGVKETRAMYYKNNPDPSYLYEGKTGNGYYWIRGADEVDRAIFCNTEDDLGGWCLLLLQQNLVSEYYRNVFNFSEGALSQFSDNLLYGNSFNGYQEAILDCGWITYNELKLNMYLQKADTSIVVYNSLGFLRIYDCSFHEGITRTERDGSTSVIPFGNVLDTIVEPEEQTGLSISFFDYVLEYDAIPMFVRTGNRFDSSTDVMSREGSTFIKVRIIGYLHLGHVGIRDSNGVHNYWRGEIDLDLTYSGPSITIDCSGDSIQGAYGSVEIYVEYSKEQQTLGNTHSTSQIPQYFRSIYSR